MSDPFAATATAAPHAPRSYFGKYPGLVMNNAPEADDPHRGRLLVQVPGILEETPDGESQQPVQLLAKPCFPAGFFFIPEVGAQVWVEFAAGDVNEPLWSGAWYPEDLTPKTVADEPPTAAQKIIRTASGHVVQLDDTEGEEKVMINHKSGSYVSIDKDGTVVIGNHLGSTVILNAKDENVVIVDQHANSVSMTDEGITLVQADGGAAVHLGKDLVRVSGKTVAVEGATVGLGKGADAPVIMAGPAFQAAWNAFLFHTHPTAMGPSGPPLPPPSQLMLAPGQNLTSAVLVK
jgi:hypothetical protein